MAKSFREYLGLPTIRVGGVDSMHPIADLGDKPPRGQGSRDSRAMGLQANYTTQGVGSIKPFLTADAKKLQQKNWSSKGFGPKKEDIINTPLHDYMVETGVIEGPRIARKPGQKAGSDKHSDLYTDENPKGTIHCLGFTDKVKATQSINKIKGSGKTHAHKMQAAIAMSQRAKVASERAKDPEKKKDLASAHKTYQSYINQNKKSKD